MKSTQNTRSTAAELALPDQTNILPVKQLMIVFTTLAVSLLVTFIDQNGISVTLPTIAADLDAADTISWAGTASLVANTTFQMLYGRLSDIFGRKNVLLGAIALLSMADVLCGLSRNAAMFYVFRAMAGIGGGGITNLAMIIVSDVVTLEQRGKYQGILGATVGLGNVSGPFLAAAFVEYASWRAFFFMLGPLAALAGAVAFFFLPDRPEDPRIKENAKKIDYAGAFTSSLGVTFLLIAISGGGAYFEWRSALVICLLSIGSLSMIAFVLVEWKIAKLPMMPLSIFRGPAVSILLIQSFLFGAVYQSYLYYIPLYLQNVRRYSTIDSAAIYCALVACQTILSVLSGQYISRTRRYGEVLWAGFISWTIGAGLTLLYTKNSSPGLLVTPLMFIGFGVGCIFQPTLVALQAHSTKARRAVIISNRNFFRCAGGAFGLAASAAVLQGALRSQLPAEFAYLAKSTYVLPSALAENAVVLDAYMLASRAVFILQVPVMGLCLLGCALVRDRGLEPVDDTADTTDIPLAEEVDGVEVPDMHARVDGQLASGDEKSPRAQWSSEEKEDLKSTV